MPNSLISRWDAHAAGLTRFYTGRPCKRGHVAERYVSTQACLMCLNPPRIKQSHEPQDWYLTLKVPPRFSKFDATRIVPMLQGLLDADMERKEQEFQRKVGGLGDALFPVK
jgi:hypothetical protein